MTTVPASARLSAYSTLPSPSTPYTAPHNPSARPYTPMTAAPPKQYMGGQNRATRGKIFPDEYLRDRQHSACYRYRVHQPDSLRPAQYADLSVAEYLRGVAQDATRIKDHRVLNTYPRDPPTWSQALIQDTKIALGQAEQDAPSPTDEIPMWDMQYIDSPWNDYQAHFKSVAAHDQEWRRQVKSHKVEVEAQWKEEEEREKRLAATGGGARVGSATAVVAPAGPGPSAGTANGLPGAPPMPGTPAPTTAAPSTPFAGGEAGDDSQPAPGSVPAKRQKGGANGTGPPKPPTLSKAAQQANARKLEEQRSAQQMTQELTRSMGRKRKAWMLGGTPGASSPSTPTADLLGKKKRKLGEGKPESGGPVPDLTGSPMPSKTMSGIVPGSPVPLGKRSGSTFTAAIPSGLNPHAKRMKSLAPEETSSPVTAGVKSESGTPAPEQDPAASPTAKDIFDFPAVPDSMTIHDVRTAYRRRIRHGGAFKRILEQRHEVLLLEIARREHTRHVTQQGGGALGGKKDPKPAGAGLLSLGRR